MSENVAFNSASPHFDEMEDLQTQNLSFFSFSLLGRLTYLAVLIIGSIGAARAISPFAMGWTLIGLQAGKWCFRFCQGDFDVKVLSQIPLSIALITIGALGVLGYFTAPQMGWGIVGGHLSVVALSIVIIGFHRICNY